MADALSEIDPFDLPDWLGTAEVTWCAESGVRQGHHVAGSLASEGQDAVPCDLLAVDDAYPAPVADDATRSHAHQSWRRGEVLLVERQGRLTLAVPGCSFTAEGVLDAVGRLTRAVGAAPQRYAVRLRLGD